MLVKTKIKYIQTLGQKKSRDEEGVFIAEGPKIINEFLAGNASAIREIFATKEWVEANKKQSVKVSCTEIQEDELKKISQLSAPNQVLAIIKKADPLSATALMGKIVLALDGIQDPGNMGTLIRLADWFGVKQIVCSTECADMYNPKVVQATMGSIIRVQLLYTDLAKWLLSQKDVRIYAAALEGQNVTTIKKPAEGIIIIGNESRGISEEIMELANVKITIPRKGKAESLNAAVAAGIILSHLC